MWTSGQLVDFVKRNAPEPASVEIICTRWGRTTALPGTFSLRKFGRQAMNIPHGEIPWKTQWSGEPLNSLPTREGLYDLLTKLKAADLLRDTPEVQRVFEEANQCRRL